MWEHAGAGAAQRYVRLAQTRRTARTWQLNTGAAAMQTRYGPGVSIPTDNGAEIEALAVSNPSFAAWEQNESYTIALLIKGRSGGASTKHLYRSGNSSTGDHILFLTSGTTPNLRHQASGGGSVTITSSVAIVNDTTWSTIVGTWRPGRLELYVDGCSHASSTAAATSTSPVRHLPLGLGLLDVAGLQRRHRTDRVLRRSLDPRLGAAVARRSVRRPAPLERGACAHRECATLHAILDRHRRGHLPDGVASKGLVSASCRVNPRRGEAALAYCEGLTDYDLPGFPPLHAALAEHFSQKQVAEIAATVINMNLWTRLKLGAIPVAE
ncbi:MAG: LamG-like jellyroll fold domain-containing protein [Geminicoccaceae bacterium]